LVCRWRKSRGLGVNAPDAGELQWDKSHHGSGGYLAYLITGDYFHLETMQYQSALCYLATSTSSGDDTSRIITAQTRGIAWMHRTIGQLVAIAPSDSVTDDLQSLLSENVAHWDSISSQAGMNSIGYWASQEVATSVYDPGHAAPWQQHFWVQTYGMLADLEPLSNMTKLKSVRDYLYRSIVGILGGSTISEYCFEDAGSYTIQIADGQTSDETSYYDSWGVVYDSTHGGPNTSCGNTLDDPSATDYWANLLPAIAYAVEDTATGAYDSWARVTGATNFSTWEASGFDDTPIWGIYPRATPQAASSSSSGQISTGSGRITTGSGKIE